MQLREVHLPHEIHLQMTALFERIGIPRIYSTRSWHLHCPGYESMLTHPIEVLVARLFVLDASSIIPARPRRRRRGPISLHIIKYTITITVACMRSCKLYYNTAYMSSSTLFILSHDNENTTAAAAAARTTAGTTSTCKLVSCITTLPICIAVRSLYVNTTKQ